MQAFYHEAGSAHHAGSIHAGHVGSGRQGPQVDHGRTRGRAVKYNATEVIHDGDIRTARAWELHYQLATAVGVHADGIGGGQLLHRDQAAAIVRPIGIRGISDIGGAGEAARRSGEVRDVLAVVVHGPVACEAAGVRGYAHIHAALDLRPRACIVPNAQLGDVAFERVAIRGVTTDQCGCRACGGRWCSINDAVSYGAAVGVEIKRPCLSRDGHVVARAVEQAAVEGTVVDHQVVDAVELQAKHLVVGTTPRAMEKEHETEAVHAVGEQVGMVELLCFHSIDPSLHREITHADGIQLRVGYLPLIVDPIERQALGMDQGGDEQGNDE